MNGYNFTQGLRTTLAMAREEAARLHHEYVGTEHILLGMLCRDEGVAMAVLRELAVDTDRMRTTIEETVQQGKASHVTGPDLPYTTRGKQSLELAMREARTLGHSYVGSEHLLLGLLREGKGLAAQVLHDAGVSEDLARAKTLKLLGAEPPARSVLPATLPPEDRREPVLVVVEVRYESGWLQRREFRTAGEAIAFLDAGS